MTAYGAPDHSLRKLIYAIQEVVRSHLVAVFKGNNINLQLQQAFLLHLEIRL